MNDWDRSRIFATYSEIMFDNGLLREEENYLHDFPGLVHVPATRPAMATARVTSQPHYELKSATQLSVLEKNTLEDLIGEVRFTDTEFTISEYRCNHCRLPAVYHAFNKNCDHMICRICLENESVNGCPVCRQSMESVYQSDQFEKTMMDLRVYCPFKTELCDRIIPLHAYLEHKTCCPAAPLPLSYMGKYPTTGTDNVNDKLINFILTVQENLRNVRKTLKDEFVARKELEKRVENLQHELKDVSEAKSEFKKRSEILLLKVHKERKSRKKLEDALKSLQDRVLIVENRTEGTSEICPTTSSTDQEDVACSSKGI